MEFTAEIIANFLEGKIEGDPNAQVIGVSPIEKGEPNTLSFLANPKYNEYIYTTKSSIVLVNEDLKLEKDVTTTLIRVKDSYSCYAKLLELHQQQKFDIEGVSEKAFIDEDAELGENLYIGQFVSISEGCEIGNNVKIYPGTYIGENVKIGNNTIIYPNANLLSDTVVGENCIIHTGAVIGDDGFGFAPEKDGTFRKIAQLGNVILEDNVEIGSNACIDRAALGSTRIKKGTKIDNLVQIGHNVEIGTNTGIAGQAGIAGSTTIGDNCLIAGQVGVAGHLTIPNRTILTAQCGVPKSIKKEGQVFQGSPIQPILDFRKSHAVHKDLPDLRYRLFELEKRIKELEKHND
jgi:UDP-3-O-[3-hydroxymyristoyl] glucosamine N-acyltransferase